MSSQNICKILRHLLPQYFVQFFLISEMLNTFSGEENSSGHFSSMLKTITLYASVLNSFKTRIPKVLNSPEGNPPNSPKQF